MVVPVPLLLRAPIDVKNDFITLDDDICDLQLVAGFGGRSVSSNLHGDGLLVGRNLAGARQLQTFLTFRNETFGEAELRLHRANQLQSRLLSNRRVSLKFGRKFVLCLRRFFRSIFRGIYGFYIGCRGTERNHRQ